MADRATPMDAIEIAEFLDDQGTGVLSLARDDHGYGIPVAFAYDDAGPAAYVRLGYTEGSTKREYLEAADQVSLVVYDRTDDGWKSVVIRGSPEVLTDTSLDSTVLEAVRTLEIPFVAAFDRPAGEVDFEILRIDATDVTGIVAG